MYKTFLKKWWKTNLGIELRTAFDSLAQKILLKKLINNKTSEQNKDANRFRDIAPQSRNLLGALQYMCYKLHILYCQSSISKQPEQFCLFNILLSKMRYIILDGNYMFKVNNRNTKTR